MQINGTEGNLTSLKNLTLPAKVVELIQKLASQPLELEKILLNQPSKFQLQLAESNLLKQLRLPLSTLKLLSLIKEVPVKVQLNLSNNQVVLEIKPQLNQTTHSVSAQAPLNQTNPTKTSSTKTASTESSSSEKKVAETNNIKTNSQTRLTKTPLTSASIEPIKIYFNQAKLVANNQLELSQPILPKGNKSQAAIQTSVNKETSSINVNSSKQTANVQSSNTNTAINNQARITAENQALTQYIQDFLKSRPIAPKPISANLNQLIQLGEKLLLSLKPSQNDTKPVVSNQSESLSDKQQRPNRNNPIKNSANKRYANKPIDNSSINNKATIKNPALLAASPSLSNEFSLNKSSLLELVTKTPLSSSKTTIENKLQDLFKQIVSVRQTLKLPNKIDSVESRTQSSGNFFESKLFKNQTSPNQPATNTKPDTLVQSSNSSSTDNNTNVSSVAATTKKPLNETVSKSGNDVIHNQLKATQKNSSHVSDLKQALFGIKQTLQEITDYLSRPQAQPIRSQSFLEQIVLAVKTLNNTSNQNIPAQHSTPNQNNQIGSELEFKSPFLKQLLNTPELAKQFNLNNLTVAKNKLLINQQINLIKTMLNETQAIINKIETNQMLSLNAQHNRVDSQLVQQFLIDLPMLHNQKVESFELLFESNQNKKSKKPIKTWSVTIKFDLEPLGPMFAKVSLKDERVSTQFFAQEEATSKLLSQNIHHLKQSLFTAGLDVDDITGQQGIIPDELIKNHEYGVDLHI